MECEVAGSNPFLIRPREGCVQPFTEEVGTLIRVKVRIRIRIRVRVRFAFRSLGFSFIEYIHAASFSMW